MSTTIKIVANKENKTMQWKEEIRTRRNQEAALAKRIQYLYGDTLSPKVWGPLGVQASRLSHERGGLHRAVWKAIGSIHYPIDLFTRRYAALSTPVTRMKALHKLHVTRAFCLMVAGLGNTWVGKSSPFVPLGLWIAQQTQWLLLKRHFVALCGYLPLLMTSCGTKEGFCELSSWSSAQPSPLCSWSLSLMAALVYVDLLFQNCAPLDMDSIAPFCWEVLVQRAALSQSIVKLLAPPASSPTPTITHKLSHCIGLTQWFIPQ